MTLIEQLTEVFKKAITRVFKLEASKNPWYLRQTILGCRFRAFVGIVLTFSYCGKELVQLLALAIAKHRTEDSKHNDDKTKTIESLSRSLNMDVSEVKESSFWNP